MSCSVFFQAIFRMALLFYKITGYKWFLCKGLTIYQVIAYGKLGIQLKLDFTCIIPFFMTGCMCAFNHAHHPQHFLLQNHG